MDLPDLDAIIAKQMRKGYPRTHFESSQVES